MCVPPPTRVVLPTLQHNTHGVIMEPQSWDRLTDALWLLHGLREPTPAPDNRKVKVAVVDMLVLDTVRCVGGAGREACCAY